MSHLLKKHHFHFCTTGKNKSMMLNQKYLQESVSWVDLGCWPSPTIPRVSSNPRCSNTTRITGMAPTSGVTESLRIQGHRNSCLSSGMDSFWSETDTWIRPGVLALHPLLKHPEGARFPGILKCSRSQDHRGSSTPRRSDTPRNTGVLTEEHSWGHNIFPNTLCIWDPHKNQGNKIILPARGTGSLQYATVSRENLGLWHLTKSCNTKKKLNPQELWHSRISGDWSHQDFKIQEAAWLPGAQTHPKYQDPRIPRSQR